MKKIAIFMLGIFLLAAAAHAADGDSPKAFKAMAMVKKAVNLYNKSGREGLIAAVNDTKGQFVDGEYYVFIHSFEGYCLARGDGNKKRIGAYVLEDRDTTGKLFVQEMIKTAEKQGAGWVTYWFKNPATGKTQFKHTYLEKIDGALVGCGYFD